MGQSQPDLTVWEPVPDYDRMTVLTRADMRRTAWPLTVPVAAVWPRYKGRYELLLPEMFVLALVRLRSALGINGGVHRRNYHTVEVLAWIRERVQDAPAVIELLGPKALRALVRTKPVRTGQGRHRVPA